jgi:DNA-binding response OmpR family regulator
VTRAHILLVEDDRDLATGLTDALELEGYRVSHAADGRTGLREALRAAHDLVLLDAMLPELGGFDVLRDLRARRCEVPVILLTARGEELDKVRGLKLGADDYVTKPFGIMELLARIEARLRRGSAAAACVQLGEVVVDFRARTARRRERTLSLTAREFEVLELLSARRGEAVSRADLVARIWGTDEDAEVTTRAVDQHVASLRRKLGDDAERPRIIETVYGYGYRMSL